MNRFRVPVLIASLLAASLSPVRGKDADGPVFFRDPDRETAAKIQGAIELLARTAISDHENGRDTLEQIGYWAVDPLRALLVEGGVTERLNAALVLGTIGDDRAYDDIARAAVEDAHIYVPSFATLMIGTFGREASLELLDRLIRDKRKDHRRIGAVLAVAKIRAPGSFDILERIVRTESRAIVRAAAILCLGFFPDRALVRGEDGAALPVRPLLAALHSSEAGERRAAVLALALLGHRDHKDYFLRAADNDREGDPEVRRAALLALGRFPDEDVTQLLLRTIASPRVPGSVKVMAAFLLKDRRDPTALAKLKRFQPRDLEVKVALTLAVSNFEDDEVVILLINRLTDNRDPVRSAAAMGLSRLTTPAYRAKAIDALTAMLVGKHGSLDPDVRANMHRAREILEGGDPPGQFLGVADGGFLVDLPKDVEEKLLDLVNQEAEHTLGLSNLTAIKADPRARVNDEHSNLRDLKDYLRKYPYFTPEDVPAPDLAITPTPRDRKPE